MKRWALRTFLFLLLGAIVNVAVAWVYPYFDTGGVADAPSRVVVRRLRAEGAGWPMASLRWPAKGGFIPREVLWTGFAVNTAVYGTVLGLLYMWALALRRQERIKRGLCPKCAYDLRGTRGGPGATACPECGYSPVTASI